MLTVEKQSAWRHGKSKLRHQREMVDLDQDSTHERTMLQSSDGSSTSPWPEILSSKAVTDKLMQKPLSEQCGMQRVLCYPERGTLEHRQVWFLSMKRQPVAKQ